MGNQEVRNAAALIWLACAAAAGAQTETVPERPSNVRADLEVLLHVDWREPAPPASGLQPDLRRARLGVSGDLFHRVEYDIVRDFRNHDDPWRDVYVNLPWRSGLEVRAGRFKVPFSNEALTGVSNLDFVNRALVTSALSPARDTGVMVHGRLFSRVVRYQAGAFRAGGDGTRRAERRDPRHGPMAAARLLVRPWGAADEDRPLAGLALAVAATAGRVPEGNYSIQGQTFRGVPYFPVVAVNGTRRRLGAEAEWRRGGLSVSAEAMRLVDERRGQATDDGPLSDLVAEGWYLAGAWVATGESRRGREAPRRPVPGGGPGSVELAARIEHLSVRSRAAGPTPTDSPRGDVIGVHGDRAVTIGVNWYPSRHVKVQANMIHERREDAGTRIAGGATGWTPVVRVQFGL